MTAWRQHHLLTCGIVVLVVFGGVLSAASAAAQSTDGSFSSPGRFMQRDGAVIYRTSCQACHMPDGGGAAGAGVYPALAKNIKLQAPRYPIAIVVNGSRAMPPFANWLDDDQVAAVVNYVRTNFGNSFRNPVSADDVKAQRR